MFTTATLNNSMIGPLLQNLNVCTLSNIKSHQRNLESTGPVRTIYTDGSKSNPGVGAAVFGEGEIWKESLKVMLHSSADGTVPSSYICKPKQQRIVPYLFGLSQLFTDYTRYFSTDPVVQKIIHIYHVLQYIRLGPWTCWNIKKSSCRYKCTLCNCKCLT
nr:unnamed protein product [Callosobruchus analis]